MTTSLRLLVPALASLLAACAGTGQTSPPEPMSVVRSGDVGPLLRNFQSFALHPRAEYVRGDDPDVEARLFGRSAGAGELGLSHGLRLVPANEAQILIAAIGIEVDDEELRRAFGVTAGLDLPARSQRGALVVALVDPRNGRSMWRGSVSGARPAGGTPEGRAPEERLEKAVAVLLDGRPVTVTMGGDTDP